MKIAFISYHKKNDKLAWSGTNYHLYKTLSKKYEINYIRINGFFAKGIRRVLRLFHFYSLSEFFHSLLFGIELNIKLLFDNSDIIFACECNDVIAYSNTKKKIYNLLDVTYNLLFDYYYLNYDVNEKKQLINNDVKAFNKSYKIIFSSNWARNDCNLSYNIDLSNIHVIKFGANLENNKFINKKQICSDLHILFVGTDYNRKGLDIAINTVCYLNIIDNNRKYVLDIVGVNLEEINRFNNKMIYQNYNDYINVFGKLYKNNINDLNILNNLYLNSHLFLLPTRAECAGIVFAESSMFGLPIISCDTGGVKDYVINGVNGFTLDLRDSYMDYANKILEIVNNESLFNSLKSGCIKIYNEELNWDKWLKDFENLLDKDEK